MLDYIFDCSQDVYKRQAYDFVKSALLAKKSVCTSNKELVAKYGAELIKIAQSNNRNFLFEAAVGLSLIHI